jgi:hypothetical protein
MPDLGSLLFGSDFGNRCGDSAQGPGEVGELANALNDLLNQPLLRKSAGKRTKAGKAAPIPGSTLWTHTGCCSLTDGTGFTNVELR